MKEVFGYCERNRPWFAEDLHTKRAGWLKVWAEDEVDVKLIVDGFVEALNILSLEVSWRWVCCKTLALAVPIWKHFSMAIVCFFLCVVV